MSSSKKKEFPEGAFLKDSEGGQVVALPCVDIGANLVDDAFDKDVDEVLERARRAGLRALVVTGTSLKGSEMAIRFANEKSSESLRVYATCGVHPHDAKSVDEDTMSKIRELAKDPKCVAIGECGLDFDRNFSPQDTQKDVFEQQLLLAKELGKPVFMHCRDASASLREIMEKADCSFKSDEGGMEGVVHCFTGTMEEAKAFLDLGLHIGITGWICDDREDRSVNLSRVVKEVPRGKLMVETDAPYLTPRSIRPNRVRPWRNEPCLLPHVMAKVAEARGETVEDLASHAFQTSVDFFGLEAQ
ncbi:deoxyribonuclease TatD [Chloropicon primus]|uniref:Deoxyribonuclease TatD n=2 Tax=Chloropicon primus TaxID=1764295 RepID=A0A5B8MSI4_9CHLO|nr:deoxyribonuclease TatD [Chloropicon primus]UPR02822.1 deoxyribonuclease TatD [Chloropicon primus]|eukprot:QDZ23609.1 deoxyribonuclease TatD [Chloropicon primus]